MSIDRKQSMKIYFIPSIFMHVTAGYIVIKDDISDEAWNVSVL